MLLKFNYKTARNSVMLTNPKLEGGLFFKGSWTVKKWYSIKVCCIETGQETWTLSKYFEPADNIARLLYA